MRLRTKVTALFLGVVSAGVLGTSVIATRFFVSDKRDYVLELSSVAATHISAFLGEALSNLQNQLVVMDDILSAAQRTGKSPQLLELSFKELQSVQEISVFDTKGLVANMGTAQSASPLSPREVQPLLEALRGRPRGMILQPGNYLFTAMGPRLYRVRLKPRFYADAFSTARALSVALVGEGATVLVRSPEMQIAPETLAALNLHGGQAVVAREIALPQGESLLAAAAPLPNVEGVAVVVQAQGTQVSAMIAQVLRRSLPFFGGILVLTWMAGAGFSRQVVRPLERLTRAAERIGAGVWKTDLETHQSDEVGQLVRAFRRMGDELSVRDSELKQAHQKLLRTERLAVLGQFSAGIAHEVKNPLNAVLGYAQLLNRKVPVEATEDKKFLGFIMDETRRASKIITELLTFARQKPPALSAQDLAAILRYAMEVMQSQAAPARVSLRCEIPQGAWIVSADRDQILQVLSNLIANAIHALEDRPPEQDRVVTLRLSRSSAHVLLEVADTGSGISPENMSKLFQPFFSTKGNGKGTGLGLAMCHGIMEQHGGKIEASSTLGQGTVFSLYFPLTEGVDHV